MGEPLGYYVNAWLNGLEFGGEDAQELAAYALRSHGHAVFADGYGSDIVWKWKPPGKDFWCVFDPLVKAPDYAPADTPELYAYVGEDELGSGEVGLKMALVPAGLIALVATKAEKLTQENIVNQLTEQVRLYGKPIRLVRYVPVNVERVLGPGVTP
jgi:hypothetical protein